MVVLLSCILASVVRGNAHLINFGVGFIAAMFVVTGLGFIYFGTIFIPFFIIILFLTKTDFSCINRKEYY